MQCDVSCGGGGACIYALEQLGMHMVTLSLLLHARVNAVLVGYKELVVYAETKWLHLFAKFSAPSCQVYLCAGSAVLCIPFVLTS
jgi:hypothetical protein